MLCVFRSRPPFRGGSLSHFASVSGSWRRKRNSVSSYSNNDQPTPRQPPTVAEAEAERASLRRDAALGAGTPGYLTKQQQFGPTRPAESHVNCTCEVASSAGTATSLGMHASASSSSKVTLSDSETSSAHGRIESHGPECHTASEAIGRGEVDARLSRHPGRKEKSELSSDHEQGVWMGFLNMFRSSPDRKRIANPGMQPGGPESTHLGASHDLPNPNVSLEITCSAGNIATPTDGRRSSLQNSASSDSPNKNVSSVQIGHQLVHPRVCATIGADAYASHPRLLTSLT